MSSTKAKSASELRSFGYIMATAFFILTGVLFWNGRVTALIPLSLGAVFVIAGMFFPLRLASAERVWMAFGKKLSIVTTAALMLLTFLLFVVPLGLVFRILRKDLIGRNFDRRAPSYWLRTEPDGPGTRPFVPY